ncbi:hypothetical protein Bbelb_229530 [Branchiostoma belcheri]|nr:hypothetical protein Bbelb_229530 [Branchiostoma belcheri]
MHSELRCTEEMSSLEGNSSAPRAAEGPEEGPPGKRREAPDGGWGWCVVLAGFTVCFCTAGTIRSLGVFFLEFVDQFDSTYGKTSWITSITLAAMYGGGPLASLVDRAVGPRYAVMLGGVTAACGCMCASFATRVVSVYLTLGVMTGNRLDPASKQARVFAAPKSYRVKQHDEFSCPRVGCVFREDKDKVINRQRRTGLKLNTKRKPDKTGFGFSLAFLPTMTMVGRYFDRRRTLANALAWLGACTGNFTLPPVFQLLIDRYGWRGALVVISGIALNCCLLIDRYGWRGALVVISGIALNCCVCGALLRPITLPADDTNLPPFSIQLLIDRYGWRGALVVISGIALNCCVCGALLRPITSDVTGNDVCRQEKDVATYRKNAQQTARDSVSRRSADDVEVRPGDDCRPEKDVVTYRKNATTATESASEKSDNTATAEDTLRHITLHADAMKTERDVVAHRKNAQTARDSASQKSVDDVDVRFGDCRGETATTKNDECRPEKNVVTCRKNAKTETESDYQKSDYTAKADHSKVQSGYCRGETATDECTPEKDVVTCTLLAKNSQTATDSASDKSYYTDTEDTVKDSRIQTNSQCGNNVYEGKRLSTSVQKRSRCKMLEFSLLRKRHFVLYLLSFAFLYFGYYVPFVHLVPRAVFLGVGEYQAAFLVSVLSVGDFVGRVVMGTIPEIPKYGRRLHKYVVASSMLGVCSLLCPLAVTYTAMLVHSVVYGFVNGLIIPLTFAVAADLVGTKRLASGIGLLMMAEGIAASLGPPVAGALYDQTGNYNMSFVTAGSSMVLAGVIMVPVMLSASKEEQSPLDTTELVMDTREKDGERLETLYRFTSPPSSCKLRSAVHNMAGSSNGTTCITQPSLESSLVSFSPLPKVRYMPRYYQTKANKADDKAELQAKPSTAVRKGQTVGSVCHSLLEKSTSSKSFDDPRPMNVTAPLLGSAWRLRNRGVPGLREMSEIRSSTVASRANSPLETRAKTRVPDGLALGWWQDLEKHAKLQSALPSTRRFVRDLQQIAPTEGAILLLRLGQHRAKKREPTALGGRQIRINTTRSIIRPIPKGRSIRLQLLRRTGFAGQESKYLLREADVFQLEGRSPDSYSEESDLAWYQTGVTGRQTRPQSPRAGASLYKDRTF